MKKYICYGGYLPSKNDNDMHYISAYKLAQLYRINPRNCLMIDYWDKEEKTKGLDIGNRIELNPRYDGNYKI